MNGVIKVKTRIILLLLLVFDSTHASEKLENLTVLINGFEHNRGNVVVKLFKEGDDVMGGHTKSLTKKQ